MSERERAERTRISLAARRRHFVNEIAARLSRPRCIVRQFFALLTYRANLHFVNEIAARLSRPRLCIVRPRRQRGTNESRGGDEQGDELSRKCAGDGRGSHAWEQLLTRWTVWADLQPAPCASNWVTETFHRKDAVAVHSPTQRGKRWPKFHCRIVRRRCEPQCQT